MGNKLKSPIEAELMKSADNLLVNLLSKGPKIYGLSLPLEVFKDLVWEIRSERYLADVRNCLINLPNEVLSSISSRMDELVSEEKNIKQRELNKKKTDKQKSKMN